MLQAEKLALILLIAARIARCTENTSQWPPENLYWDDQCKPCPAKLYEKDHCANGGVLVGERACKGVFCEGQCTVAVRSGAPSPDFYWDGQCTACPAKFYKDSHCAQGGEIVDEKACGLVGAHCEAKCRKPQSSPAPTPQLYWDGQCTACPAKFYSHCSQGGTLVGEKGCGLLKIMCEGQCAKAAAAPEAADWIIIGGGASGCAAAAALADAGEDVLVLERGKSDLDLAETQYADTWPEVVNSAAQLIRWTDQTWGAVANVLGGGTSINGGLYIEEEADYFQENFGEAVNLSEFYESSAWVAKQLAVPLRGSSFGRRYADALHEAKEGVADPKPSVRMVKDGSWVAYATFNTSKKTWIRRGAAALLHERSDMKNLRFLTSFQVKRINFEGKRASGVLARNNFNGLVTIQARKGVILAGGAIFSPQLLQVSGIGESRLLRNLGVQTVVENENVGHNFVDRVILNFGVWASKHRPLYVGYAMSSNSTSQITIESEGWGKVTSAFAIPSLGMVPPGQRTEALRALMKPLLTGPIADIMNNMIQVVGLNHKTYSRGSVEAVSSDSADAPKVTANYFKDERDMKQQFVAMKALMEVIHSDALQSLVNAKSFKGTDATLPVYFSCLGRPQTDAKAIITPCLPKDGSSTKELEEHFRNVVVSSYHYFGSASFGKVVDGEDLLVKGTENLHVIDASIFPNPTRVNPQGTIMAMGHYVGKRLASKSRRLTEVLV